MKCNSKTSTSCSRQRQKASLKLDSWDEIIRDYETYYLKKANIEKAWFSAASNIKAAIEKAVLSELNQDGTYLASHQRRVGRENLRAAKDIFTKESHRYQICKTFSEIFELTSSIRTPPNLRIGKLTRYDISSRIAAYSGIEIKHIYLHAGTKVGARKLGFSEAHYIQRCTIISRFPKLEKLKSEDIENFLCIYKDSLPPLI